MTDLPTVALLGTGTMGAGMARNIAAAGIPLRAWNRTRAKAEPLAASGAQVVDSAAEAVRGADIVITMLFDTSSVRASLEEARDGLAGAGSGTVLLQQSTVGVEGAAELAGLADELGLVFVDAPCPRDQEARGGRDAGGARLRARTGTVGGATGARRDRLTHRLGG